MSFGKLGEYLPRHPFVLVLDLQVGTHIKTAVPYCTWIPCRFMERV